MVFLALSCIGTKGVKDEKITWVKIYCCLAAGVVLFFFNWWLLELPLPHTADTAFYIATLSVAISACSWRYMDVPVVEEQPDG